MASGAAGRLESVEETSAYEGLQGPLVGPLLGSSVDQWFSFLTLVPRSKRFKRDGPDGSYDVTVWMGEAFRRDDAVLKTYEGQPGLC
jgi:hypothetical protein